MVELLEAYGYALLVSPFVRMLCGGDFGVGGALFTLTKFPQTMDMHVGILHFAIGAGTMVDSRSIYHPLLWMVAIIYLFFGDSNKAE